MVFTEMLWLICPVCWISLADLYKLTAERLGEGAYAKVQGAVSLQTGKEYAVKVSTD